MTEEIRNLIIALIPSIAGVLGVVSAIITCVSKCKSMAGNSAKQVVELQKRLIQNSTEATELAEKYDSLTKTLLELRKDIADMVNETNSCERAYLDTAEAISGQSDRIREITAELDRIRAQIKSLLREN